MRLVQTALPAPAKMAPEIHTICCHECGSQLGYSLNPAETATEILCYSCMQNFCIVADALAGPDVPGLKELAEVRMAVQKDAWGNQQNWNRAIHEWHRENASFIVELNGGYLQRRKYLTK